MSLDDIVDGAFRDDAAPLEENGSLSEGSGQGYVVSDDNLRLGQGLQRFDEVGSCRRIQKRSRLVEQDDLGLHGQDAGQGGQPFLPRAQVVRSARLQSGEADGRERSANAPAYFLFPITCVGWTEGYIFGDGGHKQLVVGVLEKKPYLAPSESDVRAIQRPSNNLDAPLTAKQSDEYVQESGLAGAVWSQQGDGFTFVQPEVDAGKGFGSVGVPKAEILDLQ